MAISKMPLRLARIETVQISDRIRKRFENVPRPMDNLCVITTRADDQKRVLVPQAKPGQVYAVEENADGGFTLTAIKSVEPVHLQCLLTKENGFTVVVPQQPINELAIRGLLVH